MYADPKHIRQHRMNLSLTELEFRLIEVTAEYCGKQPSVVARELMLEGWRAVHGEQSGAGAAPMPRTGS